MGPTKGEVVQEVVLFLRRHRAAPYGAKGSRKISVCACFLCVLKLWGGPVAATRTKHTQTLHAFFLCTVGKDCPCVR